MEVDVQLKSYTTLKIGGSASYFLKVISLDDLKDGLAFAKQQQLPYFVLGGGSNIFFADEGFKGVVLKMEIRGVTVEEEGSRVKVTAAAGENWDDLVAHAVAKGWYGLENLSAIPGTIGAAPIQNIGAYGVEVKDTIIAVDVYDPHDGAVKTFTREACEFDYRDSIFKREAGKHLIVLRVTFLLNKGGVLNCSYRDVQEYVDRNSITPTLTEMRRAIQAIRSRKFPDISVMGTAGSFFKNPILDNEEVEKLKSRYLGIPLYPHGVSQMKISLAWILDHVLKLKGARRGNVGCFEQQPLVVVNFGDATAGELLAFAEYISQEVYRATQIKIHPEVNYIA